MIYQVTTDIEIEVRGHEFVIDIFADVDGDYVPDNIDLQWKNTETLRHRDLPKRFKAYVEKHFDDAINQAICSAPLEYSDSLYDAWKESF
tara:strand:+ start:989 stop:1258 length:270 start_codon:yes stop_codon:yes gene_type:complete